MTFLRLICTDENILKRFMKKLLLLLALVTFGIFSSCSPEGSDHPEFTLELVPVQDVEMPEFFERGRTYDLTLFYSMPSDCHYLNNIIPEQAGENVWVVAIEAFVVDNPDCNQFEQMVMEEVIVQFTCTTSYSGDSCTLKFYNGDDYDGNPRFIERTIPVH